MIAKRMKDYRLMLSEGRITGKESFSCLNISIQESNELMKCSNKWESKGNSLMTTYEYNDDLDKTFKKIALEHKKQSPESFTDVSKRYTSTIPGSSLLIRDPVNHVIRIALRRKDQLCSINVLCIDNRRREMFFNDCKKSKLFKQSKIYGIDSRDEEIYSYWSEEINSCYLEESKKGN